MSHEDLLMKLFDSFEEAGKVHAPVSPQDWEAVKKRVLGLVNASANAATAIGLRTALVRDAEIDAMIGALAVLLNTLGFAIEQMPVGVENDVADLHQGQVRKKFEVWAKQTNQMIQLIRATNHENRPAN